MDVHDKDVDPCEFVGINKLSPNNYYFIQHIQNISAF